MKSGKLATVQRSAPLYHLGYGGDVLFVANFFECLEGLNELAGFVCIVRRDIRVATQANARRFRFPVFHMLYEHLFQRDGNEAC